MQICANYTTSVYSTFFICIEYIIIIVLLLIFLKKINDLFNFPNISYDKIDLIIIYLSALQLLLFLVRLIKNYNLFTTLISINKFSQNLIICSLLLLYIIGKYEKGKITIIKYFLVTLLILDILIFLLYINDNQPFDIRYKETIDHLVINLICLIFDCLIGYKSFFNKKIMNDNIFDNNKKNKLDNIINTEERLIGENENDFINTIYLQNLNNAIIIISIYFYILVTFLISYFIDFISYFSYNLSINTNIKVDIDYNESNYNNTIKINNTVFNNSCIFIQENENKFTFWNLIICFIFFLLRDIFPYIIIYFMLFIYKLKYYQRSSF